MKTCYFFPGQGAQYPGMGYDLWTESKKVRDHFQLASDITSLDLRKIIFEGDKKTLRQTELTQIAVTLVNVAACTVLKERGTESDGCAGFSLGEYTALWDAGILGLEDLFSLVQKRGEICARSGKKLAESGCPSGMAAVIGLTLEESLPVIEDLKGDVFIANHSSPRQIVLSGTENGLERAEALFDKAGAMSFIPLEVSGPFHSPLMKDASAEFKTELSGYTFNNPVKPIYSNVTGSPVKSGAEWKDLCVLQLISRVEWVQVETSLIDDGFDSFYEVGPGKVLCGLWKYFTKRVKCIPAGRLEDMEIFVSSK